MLCEPTKVYLVYQLLQLIVLAVLVSVKDAVKALETVENYFGIALGVVLLQVLCHFKLNNLAWVLATSPDAKLRDGKRSLKLAKRACEVTEYKEAHILSTLAAACAENGDFPEAIRWSTEAVALGNRDVDEQLAKELKSYEAGKPWREKQTAEDENEGEKAESKPDNREAESSAAEN